MAYESEITQFLRKLKADRPQIDAEQKAGRAIYWDKGPIDLDQRRRDVISTVPQKPYPYQTGEPLRMRSTASDAEEPRTSPGLLEAGEAGSEAQAAARAEKGA